jgi:hypothetical protein
LVPGYWQKKCKDFRRFMGGNTDRFQYRGSGDLGPRP